MVRNNYKLNKARYTIIFNRIYHALGLTSAIALLCILGLILFPTPTSSVNALSCGTEDCQEGYTSTYANMELGAAVASVVSVGLDSNVEIDITPKSSGSFASATAALTVATNNETGFAVYMKSGNDGALVSTNGSNGSESATSIKPMVGNDFENSTNTNAWGYSLDGTSYQAVPSDSSSTPIIKESNVNITSGNEYDLTFGVNVDTTLPAGYYSGTVTVSAVANPITISSLSQLVYMQDMTHDICANTADYVDLDHYITKQLIDTRDGKKYWVAKLADGNCWMTQNLALDITEAGLKASDTDITEDWNQNSQYPPMRTETTLPTTEASPSYSSARSWNLGEYVNGLPELDIPCGSVSDIEICRKVGIINVSNSEWQANYSAQTGTWPLPITPDKEGSYGSDIVYEANEYSGIIAVDLANHYYDSHYLMGNMYQWNTALTGKGDGDVYGSAISNSSICPKNWRLPSTGNNNEPATGEYYTLLQHYGVETTMAGEQYAISLEPLYFSRFGVIHLLGVDNQTLLYAGHGGRWWSNTPSLTINYQKNAYALGTGTFVNTHFGPQPKFNGYNIRCLAR